MAKQRGKSPSLMDVDFAMRRHGIQIRLENEQSQTCTDVADEEYGDDITILFEGKKKNNDIKRSRSNSSSSSTGSDKTSVDRAVKMGKSVSNRNTTKKNSWSSESSPSPPPRAPDANNSVRNDEEDVIILDEVSITNPPEPPRRSLNVASLPVVDFESDPEHSNPRKRGIDPPSQSYYLDKRKRSTETDSCELPSWLLQGEGITYERRPSTRWDNPTVGSQSATVQSPGWQFNPTETQGNLPSTLPREPVDSQRSTSNAAWTQITLSNSQTGIHGRSHRNDILQTNQHIQSQVASNLSQAADASNSSNIPHASASGIPLTSIVPQAPLVRGQNHRDVAQTQPRLFRESHVASTLSHTNQEGGTSNNLGDASLGQMNGLVHEGRSMERERHSSSNSHSRRDRSLSRDRSRSRSSSLERRRRDSRNRSRSRSRERRRSRSRSTSKERRERRPSGSGYGNHNHSMSKERRVSGNSNHSHSSHSSERGWKHHNERKMYRGSNYRGSRGNGRCTAQAGKNFHKPRNENHNKHGNQEWLYKNRGGYGNENKWRNHSGYRNDQRVNTNKFVRGQEIPNTDPNFIPSINRTNWGNRQHSFPTTASSYVLNNIQQIPETEITTSSQGQNIMAPTQTRQDPPSNVQPQLDKDYYPPISSTKQRIAHKSATGSANRNATNTTPASGSGLEQVRQNPGVSINSTQTRKLPQTNSATTIERAGSSPSPYFGKTVEEILKLIKTCSSCFGRIFDDRKKATTHLLSQHQKRLCYLCFTPISTKGVEHKQHFIEHTNNDPDELAQCPLCHEKHKYEGMYIHLAKQHFIPAENKKSKPSGDIRSKRMGNEEKPKPFSPKPEPFSGSKNDRRHERSDHRRQQFDPQRSTRTVTNHCYKPHSSNHREKTDSYRKRQQVVDSELSEKSDASSPEKDRNGNDVEHNLIYAPREDIRSYRIPKKKIEEGS